MPLSSRFGRVKPEADDIDLSFLDDDEDIAALRKATSRSSKGKVPATSSSQRSAKITTSAGSSSTRTHSRSSSSQQLKPSPRRSRNPQPKHSHRRDSFVEDNDDEIIQEYDSDVDDKDSDDIDIDDIIASINGGGSRNAKSRPGKQSSAPKGKGKTNGASRSKARATSSRPHPSAASIPGGRQLPPPRKRFLLANHSDEGSEDQEDDLSSHGSDSLQQELEDLKDSSEEEQLRPSTRRTQGNTGTSGRVLGATRSRRTQALDDQKDDDDDDDEDDFEQATRARKKSAIRSRKNKKDRSRRFDDDEDEEDWDEEVDEDDDGEEEEEQDELKNSDDPDYSHHSKRKRSSAAKFTSGSKRQRVTKGARHRQSRANPRRRIAVRRTRSTRARPPRMRFALQGELPEPITDPPSHATVPIITIDESVQAPIIKGVPFIDDIEAHYSLSEHSSGEEEVASDDALDEDQMVSDAVSISSSDDVEAYQEPETQVEKHWPGCKRCADGPALPLYNKALSQLKRAQKREAKKRRDKSPERLDSRGRQRKTFVDDTTGAPGPVQQAEEWIEVLEDRGGWFECKTCSVSWHWGCLPQDSQKAILLRINTERTARHRAVFGEKAPPPAPIRYIDIDEMLDTDSCPDCAGYASYCTLCKANVDGLRTVEEQLGFTEAMLEQYPAPPTTLIANRLFRCKRCSRATHYECLARAQTDGEDKTVEEIAQSVQQAGWLCSDCHRWPAVERIIAWRQLDRSLWNDEEAKRCAYAVLSPRENLPREYLVKFKGKSFRETEWVPHDWLRILHQAMLSSFLTKGGRLELEPAELIESTAALASARRNRASLALSGGRALPSTPVQTRSVEKTLQVDETGQVDIGPPGPMPDAHRRIPKAWRTPDRILAVKFFFSIKKEDDVEDEIGGEVVDSDSVPLEKVEPSDYLRSWRHVAKLLVKWQDQSYEGSTWEDPPNRRKQGDIFYDCQEAYRAFLLAQKVTFPTLTAGENRRKQERRLAKSGNRFRALDDQPDCIEGGDLIDFQLEGVNWLRYGWYNQKSGILADEMGLGKTVQIITFLASIWKEGKAGPFLVVVPNATLPNWMREFEKWMPQFRVVPYWGEGEARDMISRYELFHSKRTLAQADGAIRPIKFHVVVASDTSVRIDSLPLRKAGLWDVIIVDEGQNLKSGKSLLLKRLNEMPTEHRVIMTGTPLNNNVTELFNLLNWLEPGGQWKDVKALENEYSVLKPEVIGELQKRLKPYFLRRLKKEVLDLPLKVELIVPASLRPIQKRIYRSILESNIEDIQALAASRETGGKKKKKSTIANLNNTLMQLRKCIQHPYLIAPDLETREGDDNYEATWGHQRLVDASAKLSLLQRILPKLKAGGHRILLFSQFVINLDIVEVFLRGEGYKYLRLDGNVGQKQRQKGIDAFNAPDSPYFIYMISTRAGGVGINLASADTVIIMDPDWNPHVDMQAIARAHRIGQTKKLLVFTLMCKATAEERIIEGAKRKMMLDHLIVQNLDKEDERPDELESILKFGAQALFAEGGTEESERDIRYTDEDLDSLLRLREDAGDEDEKEQDNAAGENGEPKGTFSYARVWEADQVASTTTSGVAPATVVDDDFWADLLQKHREDAAKRAEEAREKEAQEKRASRRDRIKAMLQEEETGNAEPVAAPARRGPGRPKKVPKPVVDEDWNANGANAESDSDDVELMDAVREEDELLPAVQALRRRQALSSNAAVAAAAAARSAAVKAFAGGASKGAAAAAVVAGAPSVFAATSKPAAPRPPASSTASASAKKAKSAPQSLAALQRDLIAEHRLPRPLPLSDLDLSLPTSVVRPGHLAAMRKVLLSLLHDSQFAQEVHKRSLTNTVPDLSPPHMRFQLTNTHINYYMHSFGAPRALFEAAFNIIAEDNIPAEILALPHGGAIALDWRKIRELLLRTATYMVMTLRKPKNEQPWKAAIEEWAKTQASRPTSNVINIADLLFANGRPNSAPAPYTTAAAADVLKDKARSDAWLHSITTRGDAELTKIARLITFNHLSTTSPNLMLMVQHFVDGKGVKPAYGPAKLSIRSAMPRDVPFADPEVMGPPSSIPAAQSSSSAPAAGIPSPAPPSSQGRNRVFAALSRLSAFSGGSPMRIDVSKKDLSKLNVDVAVNYRKPRIRSSRSSISGSPRSSMGPSRSPALQGDSFTPAVSVDGGSDAGGEETVYVAPSAQTCIICGGDFHFLNRCPEMQDVTRASARWFQLCDQLRVLMQRGQTDGDSDVATIKTTIKVMARKLNGLRAQSGQGPLMPPCD
ncbi:putative CHD1 - transcriptional regulator [Ustilago hordei]|uniref:Probable CHD1-transcriptional regulator n=1 Tax=Ustilago hordei TaxID=120017 RepID=I2FWC8_USTHO|nr:putative CHD1 - transcriptional regulator [Ustilago hordei]CCF51221.1 probable CHD1-transcriptional regulator [Ustilago hordei]SYW82163.1 probable CHD1 - transcriptional regulator [Ustilago hordei]